jgi:hypothetical protein
VEVSGMQLYLQGFISKKDGDQIYMTMLFFWLW